MTFGDKQGDGSFSISPGTIINVVAASAIGGIALLVLQAVSDTATLKETVLNQGYAIRHNELAIAAMDQTITTILGNQRGLEDAHVSTEADSKRLHDELLDLTKKLDGMDFILRPPRSNGH